MNRNKHIDDVFREKLKDYSKDPPAEVWDSLSGRAGKKRYVRMYSNVWKVAAGVAMLMMVGLGWHFISNRAGKPEHHLKGYAEIDNTEKDISDYEAVADGVREAYNRDKVISGEENKIAVFPGANNITEKSSGTGKITEKSSEAGETSVSYAQYDIIVASALPASGLELPGHETGVSDHLLTSLLFNQELPPSARRDVIDVKDYSSEVPGTDLFRDMYVFDDTPQSDVRRWYLTGMAAPEYSYRTVNNGDMANAGFFDNSENPLFTWSGGFQAGFQAAKRLQIQSGLFFSRSGIQIDRLSTFGRVDPEKYFQESTGLTGNAIVNVGNSIGTIKSDHSNVVYMSYNSSGVDERSVEYGSSINSPLDQTNTVTGLDAGLVQLLNFIELPLNLRYRLNEGKFKVNLLGGISSNVLVGNKVFYLSQGEKTGTGKTENIRSVNYSGSVGVSIDYEVSDHFMLVVEPRYKYYLNSINEDKLLNARPYLLGIFTGLRYRF